ncbi:MAG TPA: hypothetical protein DD477_05010 [Spirochaetaceae bacterium]|nr:MAG: hypothetical protein A2Y32_00955 [Spirochaetes bacterium GWF1_60_12]HBO40559.1 hypothetical protein [Spirochaetaceae bacterium]
MSRERKNQKAKTISFQRLARTMNGELLCRANGGLGEIRFNLPAYLAVLRAIALFREKGRICPD